MNRRETFWKAWSDFDKFDIFVSVPHGAVMPKGFEGNQVLTFGRNLPKPIQDLKWDDEDGLRATLSFNGEEFDFHAPIESIQGICTTEYMVSWPIKMAVAPTVEARANKAGLRIVK
jgi:hypothetical protein